MALPSVPGQLEVDGGVLGEGPTIIAPETRSRQRPMALPSVPGQLEVDGGVLEKVPTIIAPAAAQSSAGRVRHASEPAGAAANTSDGVLSALLDGFEPEAVHQRLRYGDSISLVPKGLNAVMAFAGGEDARPWAMLLHDDVNVPPNLIDCQVLIRFTLR